MVATNRILPVLVFVAIAASCGDGGADNADGGAGADAVLAIDASLQDAQSDFPHSGFGTIEGDCDTLDTELSDSQPGLFQLSIDFDRLYTDSNLAELTAGGQEIIADGNAGGSSVLSEVFAFEVLQRCEDAVLLKTETEIVYDADGKITDFLAEIDELKIGVSVTRAVAFPFEDPYSVQQATELLSGKLADVVLSSANVSAGDRWQKQILAVLAYSPAHAEVLALAYTGLDSSLQADTLVVVIVTNGADDFIYCNGNCQ